MHVVTSTNGGDLEVSLARDSASVLAVSSDETVTEAIVDSCDKYRAARDCSRISFDELVVVMRRVSHE